MSELQLNNSLTSMEWLFPMSINKHMANQANATAKLKMSPDRLESLSPFSIGPNVQIKEEKNNKTSFYKSTNNNNAHSIAQRAEPHRPIDLSAEYKCADTVRREGKPPYSYVNLCTFAINSSPKKKMTLNEIYQWISDNFSFYKITANGWKVLTLLDFLSF